jgi:histidinol phosphatase-like PHP family hydrolase
MMSLHNHTNFSDGDWSPAEAMEAAASLGISTLGINDHLAVPYLNSVQPTDVDRYAASVREAARPFAGRLEVFVGVELFASPGVTDFGLIDFPGLARLDYLVAEHVGNEARGGIPFWEFIEMRKRIPCPVGLAHTDVAAVLGHADAEELAELLRMERIFVELNTNKQYSRLGRQFYRYWPELFKAIGEAGGELSAGTDLHSRLADVGNVGDAVDFAASVGAGECFERCLASIRRHAGQRII